MAVFSHVFTLRTLQRGLIAEAVDRVFSSSLCGACDAQIEFLHKTVWTQVIATHTVWHQHGVVFNDSYRELGSTGLRPYAGLKKSYNALNPIPSMLWKELNFLMNYDRYEWLHQCWTACPTEPEHLETLQLVQGEVFFLEGGLLLWMVGDPQSSLVKNPLY